MEALTNLFMVVIATDLKNGGHACFIETASIHKIVSQQ